jgi:hypothetical protein
MLNWEQAEIYLFEVEKQYKEIGIVGSYALTLIIRPLIKRFNDGERTVELYDEIMSLE